MVRMDGGQVSPEALALFQRAGERPNDPTPWVYQAMAAMQAGQDREAGRFWGEAAPAYVARRSTPADGGAVRFQPTSAAMEKRGVRRRNQRLMMIGAAGAVLVLAATLTFMGLRDSIVYFVAPSGGWLRRRARVSRCVWAIVVEGTLRCDPDGATRFAVTDGATQVEVRYVGILRISSVRARRGRRRRVDLGQAFEANRVLAKNDETYMPREVAEALKQRGEWKGEWSRDVC